MYKATAAALILLLCLWPMIALADGVKVSSNDLIDKAKEYDGMEVVYAGEVIGDILDRGDYVWINVFDGDNAIGIWAESDEVKGVKFIGRYDARGDIVKVTGVFHRACEEHGGDFDIHAQNVEIVAQGHPVAHAIDRRKVILAMVLFVSAIVCMVFVLRKNQEDKTGYKGGNRL
ncbi:hypothetical protein [Mahella australiensis]|uniref:Nucleic acid binding OB-fold tRNA/helicase-type n=1 Tax=Mahella australiensis (strain DSM 15567 / CIP 107919 / 50-1 BON) TaxID=697281 RepID=F4A0C8_MAHA5|nr:hypothetical protein [Mahella australiensis]AEE97989.1 hypothetical protein Mahau_2865 [Mahella australiensis 50-1 BON]